ncbi:MAG TPA: L-ribulose-5-phosphate 4-epimerase AraD [bacterium]|nr:L-ribulose-5-phosphate 4-epimerase AraD [bacterium]HPN45754.1 L-ribulose-5-phosphate 4-epimerase AraD [bacterium]
MSDYQELKELAWKSNLELPKHGLVKFTFGNVSAIDRSKGVIAIKPSGVPYEKLTVDDMVVVDLQNNIVQGKLRPSSDTKTHLELYRNFKEIGGVCHTHSTFATAWAQAIKPIPIFGTTHADHLTDNVPCTPELADVLVGGDYEQEIGRLILQVFEFLSYQDAEMVLVASHGPFTWGSTAEKAVYNSVILEELAKMAMLTLSINPETPRLKNALINKHYQRKHGRNAYYGQNSHVY